MRAFLIDVSRGLAATGVLLSAVVHLDLYALQGFKDVTTIGPLFLLDTIAGIAIGLFVLVWRHWFPALVAAGFGAATVVAFWISVVHGLFGLKEVPTGAPQVLAEVAEYVAVAFGLLAAVLLFERPERLRSTLHLHAGVNGHDPHQRRRERIAAR